MDLTSSAYLKAEAYLDKAADNTAHQRKRVRIDPAVQAFGDTQFQVECASLVPYLVCFHQFNKTSQRVI